MRFLVIGDLHVKHDNGDDIDLLWSEIKNTVQTHDISNIVLLGDILHTHEKVYTQCLNKALEFITKCSQNAHTYILVGNHDMCSNQVFLSNSHWMNVLKGKKNITIIDTVTEINQDIIGMPYVYTGRFMEALQLSNLDWKSKKVILAHQEFKGCSMGAVISQEGDIWDKDNPIVISGHIHDYQKLGENIIYIGTPLQHSFGDASKRIMMIMDFTNELTFKEIPLSISKKTIIHSKISSNEEIDKLIHNTRLSLEKNEKIKIKIDQAEEFKLFKKTKEYQELSEAGVVFQIVKNKIQPTTLPSNQESNTFPVILENMIKNDENPQVFDIYQELVHEKIIIRINK